jgi:hypothetical protein
MATLVAAYHKFCKPHRVANAWQKNHLEHLISHVQAELLGKAIQVLGGDLAGHVVVISRIESLHNLLVRCHHLQEL